MTTSVTASGYRASVPNNAMDIVAQAWCRGNDSNSGDANPATHRTMKTVRPTLLIGGDVVHYLWPLADPLADEVRGYVEALADHAELQWRKVGFWPGTDLADRYGVPDHLKRFPCLHVRLHWRDAQGSPVQVPGPVCFGSGRFYGLGLFAAF